MSNPYTNALFGLTNRYRDDFAASEALDEYEAERDRETEEQTEKDEEP